MTYATILLKLFVIIAAGLGLHKVSGMMIMRLNEKGYISEQSSIVSRMVTKWIIVITVLLLALQELGIETTHILTALSAVLVLVAVGFVAVWSVLSNILCSFLLLLFPPFRFGDVIEIKDPGTEAGIKGKVTGLNLFFATLQVHGDGQQTGIMIRVPNTMFFQRVIVCHAGKDTQDLKLNSVQHSDQNKNSTDG